MLSRIVSRAVPVRKTVPVRKAISVHKVVSVRFSSTQADFDKFINEMLPLEQAGSNPKHETKQRDEKDETKQRDEKDAIRSENHGSQNGSEVFGKTSNGTSEPFMNTQNGTLETPNDGSGLDPTYDILADFINKELNVEENALEPKLGLEDFEPTQDKQVDAMEEVVKDEKELFEYIFQSYMKPMENEKHHKAEQHNDIIDQVQRTNVRIGSLVAKKHGGLSNVSLRLKTKMFEECEVAMAPILKYIDSISTKAEVVGYFDDIVKQWSTLYGEKDLKALFLGNLFKTATFGKKHSDFIADLTKQCADGRKYATMNVLTFPIIVNRLLQTLAFKFRDGQLPLTFFNVLKRDISLYTFACNQKTYNQMLRIAWIYGGKSNLRAVEMLYYEMRNNGFTGDLQTFAILKQVIVDYHAMKMGKADVNSGTRVPLWSAEDDKRVRTLEMRLARLAKGLQGE